MFRNRQYEAVIEAQSAHIVRLERMVESLFNTLMQIQQKPVSLDLAGAPPSTIISPFGTVEPDPGDIFNPEMTRMKP